MISVGTSIILSATGIQRLNTLKVQAAGLPEIAQRVAAGAVAATLAAQALEAGAAIVLSILALSVSTHAPVLTLVGLLVLGASVALSSTALTGRLIRLIMASTRNSRLVTTKRQPRDRASRLRG